MNKIEKIIVAIVFVIALVALAVSIVSLRGDSELGTLSRLPNSFAGTATNTNAAITTASSEILSRDVDRKYAAIVNDGANVVYLALVDDANASSTAAQGIRLNANGGTIEFDNNMPYAGSVQAITASGTSTVTVISY